MAKKNARNAERREMVEQMRRQQARKERRRSLTVLGFCVVLVLGLLGAALVPYIKNQRHDAALRALKLDRIGATAATASCLPIKTKDASGSGQHLAIGTQIDYTDAPPAFGKHWPNYLQGAEIRNFYTVADRPPLERMVHSLEHGHTILWYDDTVKPGTQAYSDVQTIATKFSADQYFMAAPWTKSDENGKAFPSGTHVALTHWTGPSKQTGVWQYCGRPSGEATQSFLEKYKPLDAPEPGAP